jgi:hydroxyacylglutathione hydrolase
LREVSVAEWRQAANGMVVIDVRNRTEWDAGHLAGARLIPLPELLERIDEVPTDREVLFQCQTGGRSAIAASLLKAMGRQRVANLIGGLSAWVAAGGAVER